MIIDKEAKLFGKINIIDLFLVAALVSALAFGAVQVRGGGGVIFGGETREFILSFFTEETYDFNVNGVNVGDNVFDHILGNFMGTVYAVEVNPAIVWNVDRYGNTVRATKEGFVSMTICVRVTGTFSEHGVMVGGNRYGVGMGRAIRAGGSAIQMRISALREV